VRTFTTKRKTIYNKAARRRQLNLKSYWYLTLKEEHRLRAVENRVLRRIFGLRKDEVTGG
jgi:hypothetical protein